MLESVPGPRWDVPVINAFPQNKVQGYTSIAVPSSSAGQSYMLLILFTLASFFLTKSWSSIGHVGPSSPICQNSIFCNPRRPLIRTWIWNKLSIKVCFKHFILTMKIQHLMITYMIFKSVSGRSGLPLNSFKIFTPKTQNISTAVYSQASFAILWSGLH